MEKPMNNGMLYTTFPAAYLNQQNDTTKQTTPKQTTQKK
jgi:hypothetical protein